MPQANLTAQLPGLGGATADATNQLRLNSPNVLVNTAGGSIDVTGNKSAAANDASFGFKSGFSVLWLFGALDSDDFTLKVNPNGSSFFDALVADRNNGGVRFPVGWRCQVLHRISPPLLMAGFGTIQPRGSGAPGIVALHESGLPSI